MFAKATHHYQQQHNLAERQAEFARISTRHVDRVPIIIEPASKKCPNLDKNKFLAPKDITVGQFLYIIRKRLSLEPDKALFLFVNQSLPCSSQTILELQQAYQANDGFLYMKYDLENTFG